MGAKIMGPRPKPITNMVTDRRATVRVHPNSSTTPSMAGVMTDEQRATERHVMAITMVHHHLYAFDQFFGLPGSLVVNVTRLYLTLPPVCVVVSFGIVPVEVSSVNSAMFALLVRVR